MRRLRWSLVLLAAALVALAANPANADRVPSSKTVLPKQPGVRGDITVPYTTNGFSTLGVYQGVGPLIYASPNVEDRKNPDVKPVFNLPFWGGVQSFGDRSEGATPRPPGPPFPSK
jgi:hypothetical protein